MLRGRMPATGQPSPLFRAGLLEGVVIGLTGSEHPLGAAAAATCAALGASVAPLTAGEEDDAERAVAAALQGSGALDVVVIDAAEAAAGPPESALDGVWNLVRAAATAAMIPGERGGKFVFVAPPPRPARRAAARRRRTFRRARRGSSPPSPRP